MGGGAPKLTSSLGGGNPRYATGSDTWAKIRWGTRGTPRPLFQTVGIPCAPHFSLGLLIYWFHTKLFPSHFITKLPSWSDVRVPMKKKLLPCSSFPNFLSYAMSPTFLNCNAFTCVRHYCGLQLLKDKYVQACIVDIYWSKKKAWERTTRQKIKNSRTVPQAGA